MLNTKKLLYIFPEVSYIAELLPGKKEHTFVIQSFRQINGVFLDEDAFIPENIDKLFSKLDTSESYQLILPDFFFTNTIVEVKKDSEKEALNDITSQLLPELGLISETHQVKPFVLTQHNGKFKVQLSAVENSLLSPIAASCENHHVEIIGISPLSWTIKSLISLEPSISICQMGSHGYLALHYIGVDQTNQAEVAEIENLAETIRTLKGTEASIQTIYLLTNELVEEKLKENLSNILPLQQLAASQDESSEMPSYVQKIIEAGMKTLSIEEYAAPSFNLKGVSTEITTASMAPSEEDKLEPDLTENDSDELDDLEDTDLLDEELEIEELTPPLDQSSDLPMPNMTIETKATETALDQPKTEIITLEQEKIETTFSANDETEPTIVATETNTITRIDNEDTSASLTTVDSTISVTPAATIAIKEENLDDTDTIDLNQFSKNKTESTQNSTEKSGLSRPVIKNKSGAQPMLKMVFTFIAVFAITVAVGVGIGIAFIKYSQRNQEPTAPVVIAENTTQPTPTATPVPTPTPTPAPKLDKATISILVVNATTKAGFAGTNVAKLKAAGFSDVSARNASDEYPVEGTYLLTTESSQELVTELQSALDLTITVKDDPTTEDPKGEYDAVLVLAE